MGNLKKQIEAVFNKLMAMPEDELRSKIKEHSEGAIAKALIYGWEEHESSQPEADKDICKHSYGCGMDGLGYCIDCGKKENDSI